MVKNFSIIFYFPVPFSISAQHIRNRNVFFILTYFLGGCTIASFDEEMKTLGTGRAASPLRGDEYLKCRQRKKEQTGDEKTQRGTEYTYTNCSPNI